ncbi:TPA: hypothetical protein ACIUD2_003347 [Salmonella enterica subsp. enterica serovar Saintpaul]
MTKRFWCRYRDGGTPKTHLVPTRNQMQGKKNARLRRRRKGRIDFELDLYSAEILLRVGSFEKREIKV